jgi:hypothetical protein
LGIYLIHLHLKKDLHQVIAVIELNHLQFTDYANLIQFVLDLLGFEIFMLIVTITMITLSYCDL